ncbi:unnamed protein product [Brassica napus]|uniref:(rape) hypothetical protein n=1 Tax=Brassica napus TaxID=3708 RepID=A0A816PGX8_BRANA|nr:unnamed protein product [Brassica napus]
MANNPRVFLDISVSSKTVGRISIYGPQGGLRQEARPSRHSLYGNQRILVHAPHEGVPSVWTGFGRT